MIGRLSQNTQAILLLTAPLLTGKKTAHAAKPLTLTEYKKLVDVLRALKREPGDLLGESSSELLEQYAAAGATRERLRQLLSRGFLLTQALELWSSRSIWVVSRADSAYPTRLKSRLGQDAPPVLYGCGEASLLERGGIAVVGSRDADPASLEFARGAGAIASSAGASVVSGGARGIDQAGVSGALDAGGTAIAVVPDHLDRAALSQDYREHLRSGALVVVSPYDPFVSFSVGHAMQRNKLIYALADIALVVSSTFQKGGTWAGAVEQLEKLKLVPVYTRAGPHQDKALAALRNMGALPFPDRITSDRFRSILADAPNRVPKRRVSQQELGL